MYFLKMFLGNIFIAKYPVDFVEMNTEDERQVHLELLATNLYWEHYKKIQICKMEPVFFVDHVQSKMNDLTYFEEQQLGEYIKQDHEDKTV